MRKQRFGSFELEVDDGYTDPMDYRDYNDDIQGTTRTRLRDPSEKVKSRKAKPEDGFTFNQRIR